MDGRFYGDELAAKKLADAIELAEDSRLANELAAYERARFLATTDAQRDWSRIELDHVNRLAVETKRHAQRLNTIKVIHERDMRRWELQHNK
jgi:hypothetical protein